MSNSGENTSKTYKDYAKKFREHTENERERRDKDLNSLFPILKSTPEEMYEMQALALSYRHLLADEIAFYMNQYFNENKKLRVYKRDRYVYYSTGTLPDGRKPTPQEMTKYAPIVGLVKSKSEKDMIIEGDLSDHEYLLELLDNHVVFLKECVRTIDHTLYGIKNRLEVMKLLTN